MKFVMRFDAAETSCLKVLFLRVHSAQKRHYG